MAGGETEVFLRRASGLVRTISPWDALIYAWVNPGPVYAFIYIIWAPGLYPGASMPLGVLMVPLLLPIMTTYYLFSVSMPRSGGEYLYCSRILHPVLGLFASWALAIIGISWSGQLTSWMMTWGIGDLLQNIGYLTGNKAYFDMAAVFYDTTSMQSFVVATLLLIFAFFLIWRGAKTVMRASWVCFVVSFIGLAAIVIAALTSSTETFINRLRELTGVDYYRDIIQKATEHGFSPGYFSLEASIMAGATYINLNTLGSTYTTNVAGEVKQVTRAQPLALYGSLFLFMLYWGIFYGVMWLVPGGDFWVAWSMLVNAHENPIPPTSLHPIASGMVVFLTDNPILIYLAIIGFIFGNFGGIMGLSFGPTRTMFAWAFDRILPEWFTRVDRRGSPYGVIVLAWVIAMLFYVLYSFTPFLQYILFTITVWFIGWVVVGIAGALFPYLRRDIYEKSPSVVQAKVGRVPIVVIAGALTAIVSAVTVYFTTVPAITGLASAIYLGTTVLVLVVLPIIIYYVAYFYRRAKGIRMELQYKYIPPD